MIGWNTIESLSGPPPPAGVRVDNYAPGTVVEGNIIRNVEVGIEFRNSTGNFLGNNRVSAPTPFVVTDCQTAWGGNVSFGGSPVLRAGNCLRFADTNLPIRLGEHQGTEAHRSRTGPRRR